MFDPTAFDNMKVVIEGALYDLDLEGKVKIIDRDDFVNLAKMSRRYKIIFTYHSSIKCILEMEGHLENLAAELLARNDSLAGVQIILRFEVRHENHQSLFLQIKDILQNIWGKERSYEQVISYNPLEPHSRVTNLISVHFNRLILEDQIDDCLHMLEYMEQTVHELAKIGL